MPSPTAQWPAISQRIWDAKYRLKRADGTPVDGSIEETWRRVAKGAANAERKADRAKWAEAFYRAMTDFAFLPAGRILSGAGTARNVTLFNCFVMGRIEDDLSSIFENVREAALTMQSGGGIGHDFSTLRPRGAAVKGVGADASGPVSFMDVWDAMCRTILSAGTRRGAMMGTLRCDHPDIEEFVAVKADANRLRMFNLSVLVTDAFVAAVRADGPWDLVFEGQVYRTVRARELWRKVMSATYAYAEPGVIFIDRVNAANTLSYCETIQATNPCGEQPLPAYGACLLGSINLARFVKNPFARRPVLDIERVRGHVRTAVRFMDNVIDVSRYPLAAQKREAKAKRRIGLGLTGLGDALAMCGVRYGGDEAAALAATWMAAIKTEAYRASARLAEEKGAFPLYDSQAFLVAPGVAALDGETRDLIARHGIRNGLLTSIAPTGTISLLAHNVSSGIEPIFDLSYTRHVQEADGSRREETVEDYAYGVFRARHGETAAVPDAFVTAHELSPDEHLKMQAALQPHVDSAISKTINCARDISFEAFEDVYLKAYDLGLKGCTTYRPNEITGSVLEVTPGRDDGPVVSGEGMAGGERPGQRQALQVADASGDVVYMSEPLERAPALTGATYKIRWPESDHALYITINDIARGGRRRPFEIFINTKNLEHYAWIVALTRMISAVFRRGGDVSFVVDELKDVFDPRGGHWVKGKYVPSLIAAIGGVVEEHMRATGFLADESGAMELPLVRARSGADPERERESSFSGAGGSGAEMIRDSARAGTRPARSRFCPRCNAAELIAQEGCLVCRNCGYAKCS